MGVQQRAEQKALGGCSCSPFTDLAPICYKTRSWRSRKGNLGRNDKEEGSPMAEKASSQQSSCGLQITVWSGWSSCHLPCFLSICGKARKIFHLLFLRPFPCAQEGRTSAFMLSLQDILMAVGGNRGLGLGFRNSAKCLCIG